MSGFENIIKDIVTDIINDYDLEDKDIYDITHEAVDGYLEYYNEDDYNAIIIQEAGSIYDAIKLYENEYGELSTEKIEKKQWYAMLAFISIIDKVRDELEEQLR
jgi:hypothetical protein